MVSPSTKVVVLVRAIYWTLTFSSTDQPSPLIMSFSPGTKVLVVTALEHWQQGPTSQVEKKKFLKLQNKGSGGALFLWRLVAISNQNHPRSQMCGKKPFNRVFNALLSDIDCWPGQQKHNAHFAMLNAQSSMCNCAMLMHWQHQFTKETEGTHNSQLFSNGINRFIVTKKDVQFWLLSRDQVLNLTESHLQFSGPQSILGRKRAICKVPIWVVSGPLIPPVSTSRPPDPPWKRYK